MLFSTANERPFTAEAVQLYAPAASGVYAIYNAQEWIFIGESADIRKQLLRHLGESGCIQERVPRGFTFELCGAEERLKRQQELILQLRPACNVQTNSSPAKSE